MYKLKVVLIMGLMIIFCGIYVYGKERVKKDGLFVTGREVVEEKEVIILNRIIKIEIKKDKEEIFLLPIGVEILNKDVEQAIKDAVFDGVVSEQKGIVSYQISEIKEKGKHTKAEVVFNKGVSVDCPIIKEEEKDAWVLWPEGVEITNFPLKKMIERRILKKYESKK